jgi:hypothetical protein
MNFDKLIQRLEEGTSPLRTLYHSAVLHLVFSIVESNTFKLKRNDADLIGLQKIPEIFIKYPYYMSAARVPANNYIKSIIWSYVNNSFCTLELDAAKLSDHGYVLAPINFDGRSGKYRETEDRVISKKDTIPNFVDYIKAFHIYFKRSKQTGYKFVNDEQMENILNTDKPCYEYESTKDLLILNRAKRNLY